MNKNYLINIDIYKISIKLTSHQKHDKQFVIEISDGNNIVIIRGYPNLYAPTYNETSTDCNNNIIIDPFFSNRIYQDASDIYNKTIYDYAGQHDYTGFWKIENILKKNIQVVGDFRKKIFTDLKNLFCSFTPDDSHVIGPITEQFIRDKFYLKYVFNNIKITFKQNGFFSVNKKLKDILSAPADYISKIATNPYHDFKPLEMLDQMNKSKQSVSISENDDIKTKGIQHVIFNKIKIIFDEINKGYLPHQITDFVSDLVRVIDHDQQIKKIIADEYNHLVKYKFNSSNDILSILGSIFHKLIYKNDDVDKIISMLGKNITLSLKDDEVNRLSNIYKKIKNQSVIPNIKTNIYFYRLFKYVNVKTNLSNINKADELIVALNRLIQNYNEYALNNDELSSILNFYRDDYYNPFGEIDYEPINHIKRLIPYLDVNDKNFRVLLNVLPNIRDLEEKQIQKIKDFSEQLRYKNIDFSKKDGKYYYKILSKKSNKVVQNISDLDVNINNLNILIDLVNKQSSYTNAELDKIYQFYLKLGGKPDLFRRNRYANVYYTSTLDDLKNDINKQINDLIKKLNDPGYDINDDDNGK
jgi:REP element-mobilizing transposase RayT